MSVLIRVMGLIAVATWLVAAAACADDKPPASTGPAPIPTATVVAPTGDLPAPDPSQVFWGTGGGVEMLTEGAGFNRASWGPHGEILIVEAVYSGDASRTVLFLKQSGGALKEIVELEGYVSYDLLWSPDGTRLVFPLQQFLGSKTQIKIVSVDLSTARATELGDEGENYPDMIAWPSPDEVLMLRRIGNRGILHGMDPATGEAHEVTDVPVYSVPWLDDTALSSDSLRLLIGGSDAPGKCDMTGFGDVVYVIDLATGEATKIAQLDTCSVADIAWSPDESRVAYARFETPGDSGAFVADPATGASHRISHGLDAKLQWVSDETLTADRLACWNCDGGVKAFMAIRADGGGEEVLLEGNTAHALSASGDRLLVADDEGVRITTLEGALIKALTGPEPGWGYWDPEWAPDDTHFSFARSPAPNTRRLFQLGVDSGDLSTLASVPAQQYPSPDGKRVAILKPGAPAEEKTVTLWLADPGGSNEIKVDVSDVGPVAWSPDGRMLAFSAYWDAPLGNPDSGVYTVNADGSGLRNLETAVNDVRIALAWSPDGEHLAVPDNYRLYLIDLQSGDVADVDMAAQKFGAVGQVSWSGDSQTVAVITGALASSGASGVVLVDAHGTNLRAVPGLQSPLAGIGPSPDAGRIAYWAMAGDKYVLFRANAAAGEGTRIISSGIINAPEIVWSPDGSRFATFMSLAGGSGIFMVDSDDLEIHQVTDGGNVTDLWWYDADTIGFTTETGGL